MDATHGRTASKYPIGVYPIPNGSALVDVPCRHCKQSMGVTKWDHWNGFLVTCPRCGGYHGKPWNIRRTLVAGLFFNALSFFFTMRPRLALSVFVGFIALAGLSVVMAGKLEGHDWALITSLLVIVLGPVLINAALLVAHQVDFDAAPQPAPGHREA